jgi:hypothetical protein
MAKMTSEELINAYSNIQSGKNVPTGESGGSPESLMESRRLFDVYSEMTGVKTTSDRDLLLEVVNEINLMIVKSKEPQINPKPVKPIVKAPVVMVESDDMMGLSDLSDYDF